MGSLRILVADNSATYKSIFSQAAAELDSDAVVTCVADGDQALEKIKRFDYEIVIVDVSAANLDVLLKEISVQMPKAFVLVTARPSDISDELCDQLPKKCAADFLVKPIHSSYSENYELAKNTMSDIIKSIRRKHGIDEGQNELKRAVARAATGKSRFRAGIVLIAASTGGPQALERIVPNLSKEFPVPILIVQHMLPQFTDSLAKNLDQKSNLRVKIAESMEVIDAGTVYIAPGGKHMRLDAKNVVRFDRAPPINGVRPAADMLFESVAESFTGSGVLAVILTGMGHDGARGLAKLKEKQKCYCITQSEETSVVYGMPRAAVESGHSDMVLDLDMIPIELESFGYSWKRAE